LDYQEGGRLATPFPIAGKGTISIGFGRKTIGGKGKGYLCSLGKSKFCWLREDCPNEGRGIPDQQKMKNPEEKAKTASKSKEGAAAVGCLAVFARKEKQ